MGDTNKGVRRNRGNNANTAVELAQRRLTTYKDEMFFTDLNFYSHFILYGVKRRSHRILVVSNCATFTFTLGDSKIEYSAYMSCRGCFLLVGAENGQNN